MAAAGGYRIKPANVAASATENRNKSETAASRRR